jgi:hypothetical protein
MTLRNAPLSEQDARSNAPDLPDVLSKIFLPGGLDDPNHVDPAEQIGLSAQSAISPTGPRDGAAEARIRPEFDAIHNCQKIRQRCAQSRPSKAKVCAPSSGYSSLTDGTEMLQCGWLRNGTYFKSFCHR